MTETSHHYHLKIDAYSSHRQIARLIHDNTQKGGSLLDLGCDVGFLGRLLAQQPELYTLHGVDINKKNLKRAKKY